MIERDFKEVKDRTLSFGSTFPKGFFKDFGSTFPKGGIK
jgi:hypothetical protein